MGKQIGQGAYAVVRSGFHKDQGRRIAIKVYDKYKLLDPQRRKSVVREIKILSKMNNKYIIQLFEAFDNPKQVFLVMEYVKGISLHAYLK